jgi:hypothetical protein
VKSTSSPSDPCNNNASRSKAKCWCVYEQTDEDDLGNVSVSSNIILKKGQNCFNRIFLILQSFWFFVLNQQEEPTTKPSEQMLSTKLLPACQE